MNILIISSYLPFPLTNGGNIRLFNLIMRLSKIHNVTLICERRKHQSDDDVAQVSKYCRKVLCIARKKQWSIGNILKTGFSTDSFLVSGHTSKEFRKKIKEEIEKEKFDLIHIETFYVYKNIPDIDIPKVLVEHNIEYLVYKRFADKSRLFFRPFLYLDILKLKWNENEAWRRANKLIAVSKEDASHMNEFDVSVVPNGVNLDTFLYKKPSNKKYHSIARHLNLPEKEVLFIGDFRWIQNRDSVRWIINDIWPFLLRKVEDEVKIRLRIVGRNIPESIRSLSIYDSIIFDESASVNTSEIFQKADILLSPISVGGGTSFKILEAMASGIPVITTDLGANGLGAKDGIHLLVGNDTQTIVEKTAEIFRNEELYSSIAVNARKFIEEKYSWENIVKKLDYVYKSLL